MKNRATTPVVLFSIDGMRPDALAVADTPTIDGLIARGASTMTARTVLPSVTLPCHTSMLRGVDVARHGITTNIFTPLARPVPSLFDVAKQQGLNTGFFCNWSELRDLCEPASLDVGYFRRDFTSPESDRTIASVAAEHIGTHDLDFLMVYLGWTDQCGHQNGWMSPEQVEAIANADACVAHVLDAFSRKGLEPNVLVQSDHGGHERTHGSDMPEDMTIPWVLSGPNVRAGVRLSGEVRIFDTCPTLAHLLNLSPAPEWEGRVIAEAFAEPR